MKCLEWQEMTGLQGRNEGLVLPGGGMLPRVPEVATTSPGLFFSNPGLVKNSPGLLNDKWRTCGKRPLDALFAGGEGVERLCILLSRC